MKLELIQVGKYYLVTSGRIVRVASKESGIVVCDSYDSEKGQWIDRSVMIPPDNFIAESPAPNRKT